MGIKRHSGFTIVELLIVIVVIGILAAIVIVAFNGVTNRANDSAVRSDLANIAKQYEIYKIDNGGYPFGSTLNNGTAFKIGINTGAYDTEGTVSYQLLNCTSTTLAGSDYAMLALSKSGKKFYISSAAGGVREYTGPEAWVQVSNCATVLPGSGGTGAGYDKSGGWRSWITQ